jgi:outer membrane protein
LRETKRVGYTLKFAERPRDPPGCGKIQSQAELAQVGPGFAGADHHKEKKVNSRITFIRMASLAAACVFLTGAAWAQGTAASGAGAPGAAATGKVGVLNVRAAILGTAEGKLASAELQSQFAPRQTELENMNKQINDLRQRLSACEGKCSQDEITRLTTQGQRQAQQLERKQTEMQEDANAAQADVFDRLGRKMNDVLDRYARENGFVVLFDYSAQNTPIVNFSNQADVTQDIVRLYDQAYPVKGGVATPGKPAAAKPAATPGTTAPKPTTTTPTPTKP